MADPGDMAGASDVADEDEMANIVQAGREIREGSYLEDEIPVVWHGQGHAPVADGAAEG